MEKPHQFFKEHVDQESISHTIDAALEQTLEMSGKTGAVEPFNDQQLEMRIAIGPKDPFGLHEAQRQIEQREEYLEALKNTLADVNAEWKAIDDFLKDYPDDQEEYAEREKQLLDERAAIEEELAEHAARNAENDRLAQGN